MLKIITLRQIIFSQLLQLEGADDPLELTESMVCSSFSTIKTFVQLPIRLFRFSIVKTIVQLPASKGSFTFNNALEEKLCTSFDCPLKVPSELEGQEV